LRNYWTRAQSRVCDLELVTPHPGILAFLETELLALGHITVVELKLKHGDVINRPILDKS
jgi:hypothetical protein